MVQQWLAEATNAVEVLPPPDDATRDLALLATQVTTRSPMGAVIYESGGILVDYGWLRILGSGHPRLPRSLPEWNFKRTFFPTLAMHRHFYWSQMMQLAASLQLMAVDLVWNKARCAILHPTRLIGNAWNLVIRNFSFGVLVAT